MTVKDPDGNVHEAILTTDHPASSYGQAVLVIDGEGLGHLDVAGLELIEATDEEQADLARAGYSFRE